MRYDYETLHLDIVTHSVKIQQLEIEGDLTVGGEVDITGNVHIKGHLTVDGGISG